MTDIKVMSKGRQLLITFLITCAYPLGELHLFWRNDYSQYDIFYALDLKMDVAWIVKFLSNDLRHLFVALAFLLSLGYKWTRLMYAVSITYLVFCGIELAFFFWDFQRSYVLYAASYFYIAILIVWYLLFKNDTKKTG